MTKLDDLTGRNALVTGSATGLGRAIAVRLAERGAHVIINCSRSVEDGQEAVALCQSAGGSAELVVADVSSEEGCQKLADAARAHGTLDILVNNAGITKHARDHADLDALTKEDFLHTYSVNVVGPYLLLQATKDLLVKTYEEKGRAATVLNVSSIAGVSGVGSSVAYCATKGAFNTMTVDLARALAPAIRMNAICPGFIGTRWFKNIMDEDQYRRMEENVARNMPLGIASQPEDIADSAIFFLTDASRHVTGETLMVDAGMHLDYSPMAPR